MISDDLRTIIDTVLQRELGGIGFERAEIAESTDQDGDPILVITIHYRKIGASIDPTPTFSLARHLRSRMREIGETRFPHFTHLFPDDQELKVA
jgi:hypothetical protein